jgi:hypothetical protein
MTSFWQPCSSSHHLPGDFEKLPNGETRQVDILALYTSLQCVLSLRVNPQRGTIKAELLNRSQRILELWINPFFIVVVLAQAMRIFCLTLSKSGFG